MMYNFFAGIIIGTGLILPGVSGAVLAVILNVYEKAVSACNNIFKTPKKSILYLAPIVLGILAGVILLGNVLKYLFTEYYMQSCFVFLGLILGSIPVLLKKANEKGKASIIFIIISFVLALLLFVLGKGKFDLLPSKIGGFESFIKLFISGILFISGKVIPGISSSFMMMLVGMYDYVLTIFANPLLIFTNRFLDMIPFFLGIMVGLVMFVKLIGILLKKWHSATYSVIIGFVLGSLPAIYPGFLFDLRGLISILLFVVSFIISYKFASLERK